MVIRDILCVVDHTTEAENAFRYAANLARYHDANLFALCPVPDLPPAIYMATQFNREWLDILVAQYQSEAERLFEQYSNIAMEIGIDFEWRSEQGAPGLILEKHSRLMDLLVSSKSASGERLIATGVSVADHLINTPVPTILLPMEGDSFPPPKRILIAWNGTANSARALKQAMPVLAAADQVRIIQITDSASQNSETPPVPESPKAYLDRHEIPAEYVNREVNPGLNEWNILLREISDFDSNLLVMGAYSHSRLYEAVLGGMTKQILDNLSLPVFLVH